ncbi:MAG: hypothetical protein HQM10_04805 [Candidatus Riflebacteria bacterium]|nr:hypothetical protein [Candidatus Riflebacteria bacterium]
MKIFHRKILVLFCLIALNASYLNARQPVTSLSDDSQALDEGSLQFVSPLVENKGNFLTNFAAKLLNLPKIVQIKELGFLFHALSVEAFQAVPSDKNGMHVKTVLPYFKNSKEIEDVLKLRRTSRKIKADIVNAIVSQLTSEQISDENKKALQNFYNHQVGVPLLCIDRSPLPKILPEPGPAMIPMGVELLDAKKNSRICLDTLGILVLDIPGFFSVAEAVKNDTLDLVLCHEAAHAIMYDQYGKDFAKIKRISSHGHDAPLITDTGLAFVEGWAEAFEAVYGPNNPKFDEKDRKKYNISEFLFARQNPIRRDKYVWAKIHGNKTGELKSGLQLLSTEGVIAGFFYDILTSRSINAPFEKCVNAMGMDSPMTFRDFVNSYVKLFPDDKKVVFRIILENSKYATMSNEAAKLFEKAYQAKLEFLTKKAPKDVFLQADKAYKAKKEELFNKACSGEDIFAAVGPEMWFSGTVTFQEKSSWFDFKKFIAKKLGKDPDVWNFNLDLNVVTENMLAAIGFEKTDAEKVIAARKVTGFFTGDPLKVLKDILGEQKFEAVKTKSQLKPYQPPVEKTPESTAAILCHEDFDRISPNM